MVTHDDEEDDDELLEKVQKKPKRTPKPTNRSIEGKQQSAPKQRSKVREFVYTDPRAGFT